MDVTAAGIVLSTSRGHCRMGSRSYVASMMAEQFSIFVRMAAGAIAISGCLPEL